MRKSLFTIALLVALTAPARADLLTFDLTGLGTTTSAIGGVSYETSAPVTLTNFGGMQNLVYTPTSWNLGVTNWGSIGDAQFSTALAGQTSRLCVGICTFQGGPQLRLDFLTGTGLTLTLRYGLTEAVSGPPTAQQIGGFLSGEYRDTRFEGTTRLAVLSGGGLTQTGAISTPEPASGMLFWIALGAVWLYCYWREVRR